MSSAVTNGIRITVKSAYMADRSSPATRQYAFSYTVDIANEGTVTAQLVSRHWIITDGDGKAKEVKGAGVVGAQPTLKPGQAFQYTSWCVLETPYGSMQGTYQMVREDGTEFDAEIAPFSVAVPNSLN